MFLLSVVVTGLKELTESNKYIVVELHQSSGDTMVSQLFAIRYPFVRVWNGNEQSIVTALIEVQIHIPNILTSSDGSYRPVSLVLSILSSNHDRLLCCASLMLESPLHPVHGKRTISNGAGIHISNR